MVGPLRRLTRQDWLVCGWVAGLAAGTFAADVWASPGLVVAFLFAGLVFLSLSASQRAIPLLTAAGGSALTVLAFFASPLGPEPGIDLANRGLVIVVLWAILWLGLHGEDSLRALRQKEETLVRAQAGLEQQVRARTAELSGALEALERELADRRRAEEMTRAFLRLSEKLTATLDVDRLLEELAVEAIRLANAESGCAGLRAPEGMVCRSYVRGSDIIPLPYVWPPGRGLPGWVLTHKTSYVTNDAANDPQIIPELREQYGVRSAISTPILDARGEVLGFFNLHNRLDGSGFTLSDQAKLTAVAQAASVAIQNALAYEKLQAADHVQTQLLNRIITAQEDERRRIARELHDETAQSLTSLLIGLRALEDAEPGESVPSKARELRRVTSHTLAEIQRLARGLRPLVLDDLGLDEAVRRCAADYTEAHGIPVEVLASGLNGSRLPSPVETALYRITQEALTNAAKHAAPGTISVLIRREPSLVRLVVEDDGRGFDAGTWLKQPEAVRHLGLLGMRERAVSLGGNLVIESAPGGGTTISVTIPLPSAETLA